MTDSDIDQMDDKALAKALHTETLKTLLKRVKAGEATAADLNVARQMVKDQDIQSLPVPGSPLADLSRSLPFAGTPSSSH